MDRRLIVPAGIAASVHALLLFGFSAPLPPDQPKKPEKRPQLDRIEMVPVDIESAPAARGDASSAPPVVRPRSPEVATTTESNFKVELRTEPITPSKDVVERQPVNYGSLGDPDGVIGGVSREIYARGHLDNEPRVKASMAPDYPLSMKSAGMEGEVLVEFIVEPTGRVRDARVVRSTHRDFEEAALRAVARWRFEAGRKGNIPVSFRMALPITFRLGE